MKALTISDAPEIVLGLQDEIRRSLDSRYDHRLHGILLVAQGMTCPEVGALLGDAPRTVEYWVERFERSGLAGLREGERMGRPARLTAAHMEEIGQALRGDPAAVGVTVGLWDGKALSEFIEEKLGTRIGVRQCQRLFRRLGFRLRKPRPLIAHADPDHQAAHKKNSKRS